MRDKSRSFSSFEKKKNAICDGSALKARNSSSVTSSALVMMNAALALDTDNRNPRLRRIKMYTLIPI